MRLGWPRVLRVIEWAAIAGVLIWAGMRLAPQVRAWAGVGGGEPVLASPFEATSLSGEVFRLEDLRGRVVVLNFWATWCLPCRVEMPALDRLHEERSAEGVTVIGVATDRDGRPAVEAFLDEHGYDFPIVLHNASLQRAFGPVELLPTTILVDRTGHVRHRVEGFFAPPALSGAVERLLDEAGPARAAPEPGVSQVPDGSGAVVVDAGAHGHVR